MAATAAPLLRGLAPLRSTRPAFPAHCCRPACLRALSTTARLGDNKAVTRVAAVVVGAGPAGVATVGSLLDHLPPSSKVAWIDRDFTGGRVNSFYREVPGNTRTRLFVDYARSSRALRDIVDSTPAPNAVTVLESLPGDDTCSLAYAGDALSMLTHGLRNHPAVDARPGRTASARWSPAARRWTVVSDIASPPGAASKTTRQYIQAAMLVYCTGARPVGADIALPDDTSLKLSLTSTPARLLLNTALKPSLLANTLPAGPVTVGVVGASHSAILVLMNLYNLATTSEAHKDLKVKWFSRVPADGSLKYAEYMPDGWILWDNTGLKGRAAQFAKDNLDNPAVLAKSPVSSVIQRIDCSGGPDNEASAFQQHLVGQTPCDFVVQAIGFTPKQIPKMIADSEKVIPTFDNITGGFTNELTGKPLRGLHGAGIAFPERVTDPHGNVEHAVGFFKFVKFLNRVVPEWITASCLDAPISFTSPLEYANKTGPAIEKRASRRKRQREQAQKSEAGKEAPVQIISSAASS